ncbi:unnamed protein product [Durusdinium trenchii]|uniref:Uncharacterized protein n=2 Tax=Durusdinium trenchii TaxID=1381693 RepID=A0ABP0LKF1_9DINO
MCVAVPVPGTLYRTVHHPRVAIRAKPSTSAEIVHVLSAGEVFRVAEEVDGWLRLAADEAWARSIAAGFVLLDGKALGLGKLVEKLEKNDEELWPFTPALRRAAALGVPFTQEGELRPMDGKKLEDIWLSFWHTPSLTWAPSSESGPKPTARSPQLAVACLLRGVGASVVKSFALYHLRIGFQRVLLFFDAPDDPSELEAIEVAEGLSGLGVQVRRCTETWWQQALQSSRFWERRPSGGIFAEMVELWELGDVQSRQCLAMEAALRDVEGFDWLLHIDADEALLLPKHSDACSFFQELPPEIEQVVFNNLEALPESFEITNWFEEVTLFKVHQNLLSESKSEKLHKPGERYLEKLEKWRQRQLAKGTDPEDVKTNRSFDMALLPVRLARRKVVQQLKLDLPPLDLEDQEPIDSDEEPSEKRQQRHEDLPCFFTAYGNGKAACRVRSPRPLPIGVHRFASESNARLKSLRCSDEGAPVILHYANCGYQSWLRKYKILADGHQTEDGGFSVERKGIRSMRAHLAHRELLKRRSAEDLELYYRTYIMGNEFGELPHFACHGMLVRTHTVQEVLQKRKKNLPADSPGGFGSPLPKEERLLPSL